VLEANDRAETAYQRSKGELCGMGLLDLRAPASAADMPGQFDQVMRAGAVRFRTFHQRKDGTRFPVEVSSFAFDLEGRHMVRSIIRDISADLAHEERMRGLNAELEQRVNERSAQVETAFHELEAFSHAVSHDLRGPLRGIDGFSLALLEDYPERLDERGRHYLQRIRAGAQRLGRLIDDLVDLHRLGRHELASAPVDLSALARQILADLARQAPEPRPVELEIQDGLLARGDPRLLRLALANLLDNAWKFTAGRAPARIQVQGAPESGGGRTFSVRDNGVGFAMEHAGKLFGTFQRLHDPLAYAGTGIGLAVTQRILQLHGGRVWAEGSVGQGAVFFFFLPS
jgi:hypothetical protein